MSITSSILKFTFPGMYNTASKYRSIYKGTSGSNGGSPSSTSSDPELQSNELQSNLLQTQIQQNIILTDILNALSNLKSGSGLDIPDLIDSPLKPKGKGEPKGARSTPKKIFNSAEDARKAGGGAYKDKAGKLQMLEKAENGKFVNKFIKSGESAIPKGSGIVKGTGNALIRRAGMIGVALDVGINEFTTVDELKKAREAIITKFKNGEIDEETAVGAIKEIDDKIASSRGGTIARAGGTAIAAGAAGAAAGSIVPGIGTAVGFGVGLAGGLAYDYFAGEATEEVGGAIGKGLAGGSEDSIRKELNGVKKPGLTLDGKKYSAEIISFKAFKELNFKAKEMVINVKNTSGVSQVSNASMTSGTTPGISNSNSSSNALFNSSTNPSSRSQSGPGQRNSNTPSRDSSSNAEQVTPGPPGKYRPVYQGKDLQDPDLINIIGREAAQSNQSVDAVINNMMNRLGSKSYGNKKSLIEVAKAKNQYEAWDFLQSGRFKPVNESRAKQIQERLKLIASGAVPDITNGADQYRASSYVNGAGRGKTFARQAAEQNAPNIGGNVYVKGQYHPGTYAAYKTPNENLQPEQPTQTAPITNANSTPSHTNSSAPVSSESDIKLTAAVNENKRGFKNTGKISLPDPKTGELKTFEFVTGGAGRGSAPTGIYNVDPKMQRGGYLGDRWVLTQQGQKYDTAWDPNLKSMRSALRIHMAHGRGTHGCIGILGGAKVYADFENRMIYVLSQGKKVSLDLGSQEAKTVLSEMKPADASEKKQTISSDKIKSTPDIKLPAESNTNNTPFSWTSLFSGVGPQAELTPSTPKVIAPPAASEPPGPPSQTPNTPKKEVDKSKPKNKNAPADNEDNTTKDTRPESLDSHDLLGALAAQGGHD